MNEHWITDDSSPDDKETELQVAAARQLDAMFKSVLPWSLPIGQHLVFMLASRRLEFPDGTILGDVKIFESIVGRRDAARMMAALDPDDRGAAFWLQRQNVDFESSEMTDALNRLTAALATAGIRLGP